MTITFDLYTKKTKLYYISEVISIITAIIIGTCAVLNFQPKWPVWAEVIAEVLIIIGVFIMVAFITIASYGMLKTYITDGELVLSDEFITIDGVQIPTNSTERIFFRLRQRTRKSGWRRTGNRIEITANGKTYSRLFSINSYECNDELLQMLNIWSKGDIKYDLQYTFA